MKKKLCYRKRLQSFLGVLFVVCFLQLSAQEDGDYRSNVNPTGLYSAASSWEVYNAALSSWGPAAVAPTASSTTVGNNITILNGDTIEIAAAAACKNITIDTGGKLFTSATGNTLIVLTVWGSSIVCNGTLSGSGPTVAGGLDLQWKQSVTLSGTGTGADCRIARVRPLTLVADATFTFDRDAQLTYKGSGGTSGAGLSCDGGATYNVTYTINTGKTITFDAGTGFYTNNGSATGFGASNVTVNIFGTATMSGTGSSFTTYVGSAKTYTMNISGTLNVNQFYPYGIAAANFNITSPGKFNVTGGYRALPSAGVAVGPIMTGTGTFELSAGSMSVTNPEGLNPTTGPIRTSTRIFNPAATYSYVGTAAQTTGSDLTTIANLVINNAAGVTVSHPTTVTNKLTLSAGAFNAAGLLTLKSDATKTAVVAPVVGSITGNVIVERFIPAGNRAYRLLSPATTGGTIKANWQENQADGINGIPGFGTHITGADPVTNGFDSTTNNQASLFMHNNTGAPATWSTVTSTAGTLTAGSPYLIYIRGSRQATNIDGSLTNDATTLRTTGALATGTQAVSGLNTTADGFSLIGNPYQAQVDMQATLLASTDLVTGFYYVVDPSLGSKGAYYTIDVTAAATADYSKYLQPGQACFVKTSGAAPALSFTEANKSEASAQTSIFRTKNTATPSIDLTLLDGASKRLDILKVAFDASETNDVNQNDATKLTNFDENMATSNSSKLLSIEKRAIAVETDEIPLNITKYRGTSYKIQATGTGLTGATPYLVDAFANTITEIPQDGSVEYAYTVDTATPASIAADRFKITYTNKTLKTIDNALEGFALYPNPSKNNSFSVVVPQGMKNASITVSNLLGQKVYAQNGLAEGVTARVTVSNVKTAGVYLVSLTSEGKTATTKWIVE